MRIRKRWPASSSSSSPLVPIDPSTSTPSVSSTSPPLILHHYHNESDPPDQPIKLPKQEVPLPLRSDLQLVLVRKTDGWICSNRERDDDCMYPKPSTLDVKDSQSHLEHAKLLAPTAIHLRNKNSLGASAKPFVGISECSSSSHQDHSTLSVQRDRQEAEEIDMEITIEKMKKKRKKADNASRMMEGSRCSRVNGRGWRCCQPTPAGFSLCEHHLGKGRFNTISDKKQMSSTLSSLPSMLKKKQKKIRMVKARSISSLLAQLQTQTHSPAPQMPIPRQILSP